MTHVMRPRVLAAAAAAAAACASGTGAVAVFSDVEEAVVAGRRARFAAWVLAATGRVAIAPRADHASGSCVGSRDGLTAYNREVREHIEAAWAQVDPSISYGQPHTFPDPLRLSFRERIAYTVTEPVIHSPAVAAHSGNLYSSNDGGGGQPQLTVAAFLDPSLKNFHFGPGSHRQSATCATTSRCSGTSAQHFSAHPQRRPSSTALRSHGGCRRGR